MPRRDKFVAPGPTLAREQQPELFALVHEVAEEVGHPMPDETYLAPDANAAVTEVGPMFLAKKRVLILGLPLLELLTVDQLRAVIAHEFGHYVGGDTRVGRWIYRTRRAIVRTVDSLLWDEDDDGWFEKIVRAPFVAYAKLFLRITSAISRRQEFAADALAVKVAGRDAHVGALRSVAAGAPAFDAYWGTEVVPALSNGLRPPIGEGFRRFLSVEAIDRAVAAALEQDLEQDSHDPYDSHPTLRQRLEAVGAAADEHADNGGPPAATLIRDHADLELELLRALGGEQADELRAAGWDDVQRSFLEGYDELVKEFGGLVADRTAGDIPQLARDLDSLATTARQQHDELEDQDHARHIVVNLLGATLVQALVRAGFAYSAQPGEPIVCARGDVRFTPFDDVIALVDKPVDAEAFRARLQEAGVAEEPLVRAQTAASRAGGRRACASSPAAAASRASRRRASACPSAAPSPPSRGGPPG